MAPVETETLLARARVLAEGGNRVELGVDLEAGEGGVLSRFLIKGWSKVEPWGRWTDGREASFHVIVDYPYKSDIVANFSVHGYVSENIREQQITLLVNNTGRACWSLTSDEPVLKTLYIPAEGPRFGVRRAVLDFSFSIKSPESPRATGAGADRRLLGLGFRSVQFTLGKPADLEFRTDVGAENRARHRAIQQPGRFGRR
jgi:hypothetical protein